MKFIKALNLWEQETLEQMRDKHELSITRKRAHSILLSFEGYCLIQIAKILGSCRQSVSEWVKAWDRYGLAGLIEKKRSGRPKILTQSEEKEALELVSLTPRKLTTVLAKIRSLTGNEISLKTLKRICKRAGLKWKRIRRTLKQKKNEADYQKSIEMIAQLIGREEKGEIDLFYSDESGFNLQPSVPYAWQKVGQQIQVPSAHSQNLNVLGFINHSCQFESYVFEQPFNSSMVVACFDEFVKTIDKTTYVLIDNAPTHTSHLFKESIERWEQSNLYVKFISSYSPDLNLIEILWRKIKYDWIPFSAFQSFNYLKSDLFHILANIGSDEYTITYI